MLTFNWYTVSREEIELGDIRCVELYCFNIGGVWLVVFNYHTVESLEWLVVFNYHTVGWLEWLVVFNYHTVESLEWLVVFNYHTVESLEWL
jgi:hypothetical protein